MANNYYNFPTPFVPGTKVRSEQVNVQYQGVESAFDLLPTDPAAAVIGTAWFGTDVQGATVNDYILTTPDPQSALADGQRVAFFATHSNTGPATINVDGLGVVNLVDNDGSALVINEIILGLYYEVVYDNANTRFLRSLAASSSIPGGVDTQIQFNDAGGFGGVPSMVWDGSELIINNLASGDIGLFIEQEDTFSEALYVYVGSVTGANAAATFEVDNAGAVAPTISVINAGSGPGIFASAPIRVSDNTQFQAGTGQDFTIEHTGSLSLIQENTGAMLFRNNANGQDIVFNVNTSGVAEQVLEIGYATEAGVRINHNGNQRFQTTDNGIEIIGYADVGTAALMSEQVSVPVGPIPAGSGTYWVRNDVPSVAVFTDDDGVDFVLNSVTATPGGPNSSVQFNNAGALDGSANFTFDGDGIFISQTGTGAGVEIDVDGSGFGMRIDDDTAGAGLELIYLNSNNASRTANMMFIEQDNAAASGANLRLQQDGPGGQALHIISDVATRTVPLVEIVNDNSIGSGDAVAIQQDPAGYALNISGASGLGIKLIGGVLLTERPDHANIFPAATLGELWVRNDVPNILVYTDDAGTDFDIGGAGVGALPGGATTNVQFNNAGAFDGDTNFTWNGTTLSLTTPGQLVVNTTGVLSGTAVAFTGDPTTGRVLSVVSTGVAEAIEVSGRQRFLSGELRLDNAVALRFEGAGGTYSSIFQDTGGNDFQMSSGIDNGDFTFHVGENGRDHVFTARDGSDLFNREWLRGDANGGIFSGNGNTLGSWDSTDFVFNRPVNISNAAAGQIQFPATQNASTNANTLDDYQEAPSDTFAATMTPTTSGSITMDSSNDELIYTKIGRMVFLQGEISVASVSSPVGNVEIPIPFTSINAAGAASQDQLYLSCWITNLSGLPDNFYTLFINRGANIATIQQFDGITPIADNFQSTTVVSINAAYMADA
jgi:hypothetical protein